MRVFISWSEQKSKAVAELLKTWIKGVIQATDPFISTEDVEKGSIWFTEIGDSLASTNLGIICLTKRNIQNPWILFEAGALSKGLSKARVWTFLIDLDVAELDPPLSQFNATFPNREDVRKLVSSINSSLGEKALPSDVLGEAFDQWWPRFETRFAEIINQYANEEPEKETRSMEDMIGEVLTITRSIHADYQHERSMKRIGAIITKNRQKNLLNETLLTALMKNPKSLLADKLLEATQEDESVKMSEDTDAVDDKTKES